MSTTEILRRQRQHKAEKAAERRDHRILRLREVEARCGLKRSSIYQAIAEGTFPKSVPLTARAVGWLAHEVDAWIKGRVVARDQRAA
jgi:prophage regulatory protein